MKVFGTRIRNNFFTGLALLLPIVFSFGVIVWLFNKVFAVTGLLLVFFPNDWVYNEGSEKIRWYWNWITLFATLIMVIGVGGLTRHYFGLKVVEWIDHGIRRVPLLNRIYGTIKQVNESFSSTGRSSFRQVVLVRYPHEQSLSLGFVTAELKGEIEAKTQKKLVAVFVPTTPNPTGGFLLLLPLEDLIPLEMSVADGIKFVISLGVVNPKLAHNTVEAD